MESLEDTKDLEETTDWLGSTPNPTGKTLI